jgi:tetratricopeptide (TPR) repeat protein
MIELYPDINSPRAVSALLDITIGDTAQALDEYTLWIEDNQSVRDYVSLHLLYRATGERQKAEDALAQTAAHLRADPDWYPVVLGHAREFEAYNAGVTICRVWKEVNEKDYLNRSGPEFEAIFYLNLGEMEKAREVIESNRDSYEFPDRLVETIAKGGSGYNPYRGSYGEITDMTHSRKYFESMYLQRFDR